MATPSYPLTSRQSTVLDLGRAYQQKYPDSYGDITDLAALGRAYKQKYADSYGDVLDVGPAVGAPMPGAGPVGQPPQPQAGSSLLEGLAGPLAPVAEALREFAVAKPGEVPPSVPSRPVSIPPTQEAAQAIEAPGEALRSISAINPSGLVSREPQLVPELTGPPAPINEPPIHYLGEIPGMPPPPRSVEEGRAQAAQMERTARAMTREILGFINPINAGLMLASGGLSTVARSAANAPGLVNKLRNIPGALRMLDIAGETAVPATFTGIAGKQTKDQLEAAQRSHEAGDMAAAEEHLIGAMTSAFIAVGAGTATVVKARGATGRAQTEIFASSPAELRKRGRSGRRAAEAEEQRVFEQYGKVIPGVKSSVRESAIRKLAAQAAEKQPGLPPAEVSTATQQKLGEIFGEGVPKTLDGKPVTVRVTGSASRVGVTGEPIYELVDQAGKTVYSGNATAVRSRLRAGQAPKGTKAAEREAQLEQAKEAIEAKRPPEQREPSVIPYERPAYVRTAEKPPIPEELRIPPEQIRKGPSRRRRQAEPARAIEPAKAAPTLPFPTREEEPRVPAPTVVKESRIEQRVREAQQRFWATTKEEAASTARRQARNIESNPYDSLSLVVSGKHYALAAYKTSDEGEKASLLESAGYDLRLLKWVASELREDDARRIKESIKEIEDVIKVAEGKKAPPFPTKPEAAAPALPLPAEQKEPLAAAPTAPAAPEKRPGKFTGEPVQAEAPKLAPTREAEPAKVAVPEKKGPPFRVKTKALQVGVVVEAEPGLAERLHKGHQRLKVTEIDEDGQVYAEPVDPQVKEGGSYIAEKEVREVAGKFITLGGEKEITGYRLAPKEAPQAAPAEKPQVTAWGKTEAAPRPAAAPEATVQAEVRPPTLEERPAYVPGAAVPGQRRWRIRVKDLKRDVERFQIRHRAFGPKGIEAGRLEGLKKWDLTKEATMLAWVDPNDMEPYIVEGHQRLDQAEKLGIEWIEPVFLSWEEAPTAEAARARGALSNLREGSLDPVDAARFMRDSGTRTEQQLRELGVPTKGKVIREAQALTRLDNSIFQDVVRGRLREDYGIAIGQASGLAPDQQQARKVIEAREERTGRVVPRDMAGAIAKRVAQADIRTETQQTLFGDIETAESLFEQEADLTNYIRRQIGREKRLFGTISQRGAPEELEAAGNVLARQQNLQAAQQMRQAREKFDKLVDRAGPVDEIVKKGARRLAEGENATIVRRETYKEALTELERALPGRVEKGSQASRPDQGRSQQAPAQPEIEEAVLYSGIPAVIKIARVVAKGTVEGMGLLKEEGKLVKVSAEDWTRDRRKEPNVLFWLVHLPNYIAEIEPDFAPVFESARGGYHEALEHIADFFEDAKLYFNLPQGQARLLNEALLDADRKGVNKIDETGLDPETIEAFKGFRKGMDRAFQLMEDSIVDLATQGRVKSGAKIVTKGDLFEVLIKAGFKPENAQKRADTVWGTLENFREARRTGFVPHSRLGKWLYGIGKKGEAGEKKASVYFESSGSLQTANRRLRQLQKDYADSLRSGEYEVIRPYKKKTREESMAGIMQEFLSSQLMEELSPELGEQVKQEIEPYLAKYNAKSKWLRRRDVPGYDTDVHRAAADYFLMVSYFVAKTRMFRDMRKHLAGIPKHKTKLRKYANEYVRYLVEPGNELGWMRSLLFHYYLGLKPQFFFVNLTQVPLITAPWLLRHETIGKVSSQLKRAYADVGKVILTRGKIDYSKLPDDVREAAIQSLHDGTLAAQYARELGGIKRRGRRRNVVDLGQEISAFLPKASEHINRLVSFIAGYRIAQKKLPKGFKSPLDFAEDVVNKTQFEYARYNRAKFARGNPWSLLALFKTFPVAHTEVLFRLARGSGWGPGGPNPRDRKALGAFIGGMIASSGFLGVTFSEDIFEGLAAVHKFITGIEYDPELRAKEIFTPDIFGEMTNQMIGDFFTRGVWAFSPFDLSASLSLGQPTGIGEAVRRGSVEPLSALFGITGKTYRGLERGAEGDPRWIEYLSPAAFSSLLKFRRGLKEKSIAQTRSGRDLPLPGTPQHLTLTELIGQLGSFRPTRVARAYERQRELSYLTTKSETRKKRILRDLFEAKDSGDREALKKPKAEIAQFNRDFPENMITLENVFGRLEERAKPAKQRQFERLPETARPFYRRSVIPGF